MAGFLPACRTGLGEHHVALRSRADFSLYAVPGRAERIGPFRGLAALPEPY